MSISAKTASSKLFILDEPGVGLHPEDVANLASALDAVLEDGRHTIVMVEHDLNLIRSADWVLEFGPGGGPAGGQLIFEGTPLELENEATPTGLALSGKVPAIVQSERRTPPKTAVEASAQVMWDRTAALLRSLLTGDPPILAEHDSDSASVELVVPINPGALVGHDAWDVAGLDREVPKLLLDIERPGDTGVFAGVLETWRAEPHCWLAIQPYLELLQTWGVLIPRSELTSQADLLGTEGLQLVTVEGNPARATQDARTARATGARFVPDGQTDAARERVLKDAFSVGGHYVELRDRRGRLRGVATDRLVDIDQAVIGPMAPVPAHFTRYEVPGQCPMCRGRRLVDELPEKLVVSNRSVPPLNAEFLTPQAHAILRGVVRNELTPFLRRMASEGLWNLETPFDRLTSGERLSLLYGFWSRPGHGTFLKTRNADPSEVSAWLRWDGLYRHVIAASARSTDAAWTKRLREGLTHNECSLCEGTGLQHFAHLLSIAGMSFPAWTRLSGIKQQARMLAKLTPRTKRQRRTLDRIIKCLTPEADQAQYASPAEAVVERAVTLFTTMKGVRLPDNGRRTSIPTLS
jgi:hypothetical protein